ncbi:MAG: type II toxin-antitoxin system VapC family toxin [Egibacteraceae bacterium]
MSLLVLDASVVVNIVLDASDGFGFFKGHDLAAPPLMWSESRSVLHELRWRGQITPEVADIARRALEDAPIRRENPAGLGDEAWSIADKLGWTKTYDAEYVALAQILGCRVVTTERRLRSRAAPLGFVIGPTEL